MKNNVRGRFAPSPTGLMHLGSVRTALFNYLFAKQKNGTFILRIEDTDPERNFDPQGKKILEDMAWLDLAYDEGPKVGGPYAPYYQSERSELYQERLDILKQQDAVYRCFCSQEELEKKRARQIALKQPPRYDKACLQLSEVDIKKNLEEKKSFIWRFKIDTEKKIAINDLARGTIDFDLKHFSDFPLTRANGSFTFIFANAIDDMVMKISHVFRGEDHISNTPCQALLYQAFNVELPIFWHMPIICNIQGKKLSKRDFGFSLQDLKAGGFLSEAINNYLAIIGGSFEQEIMNRSELIKALDFEHLHSTSAIKYDVEKLTWINHQWILKTSLQDLTQKALPFLAEVYPQAKKLELEVLIKLIKTIQPELKTLKEVPGLLQFYFEIPKISKKTLLEYAPSNILDVILKIIRENLDNVASPDLFFDSVKKACKEQEISLKSMFTILRVLLTGSPHGLGIKELLELLGAQEVTKRIENI